MRVTVRVRPGASRTDVGGAWDGMAAGQPPALLVAVPARAVDGAATEAVVTAVARAFDLPPRQVRLVTGARSRTKVLELHDPPADAPARLATLLGRS